MHATPLFPFLLDDGGDTQPALRFPDRSLSMGELRDATAAAGGGLATARRVAVWAEPRLEAAIGVVAAIAHGIPVVPINPKAGPMELDHVLTDSRPDLILTAPDTKLPTAAAALPRIEIDATAGRNRCDQGAAFPPEPDDREPALIIYTSGTTGLPKGAVLPRRALSSNLDALAEAWKWTRDDVVVHGLPLFHVHGLVLGILGPLRRRGSAHHLGRFSVEGVVDALNADATIVFAVPTMYRRLAAAAEADPTVARALRRARILVSGSAPLPAVEHQRLERACGQRVIERYGMTETLMNTAVHADGDRAAGYVGQPLPGVELRLVADDGSVLALSDDETIGEIEVRGPNLFLGYLNRPDATANILRNGWFRTGDLATRRGDGYVRIVGRRATDLIKSGGYKIGAGEIETALREHPDVEDAAVTGEPDDDLGERVVAWIVLRAGVKDANRQSLVDHVAGLLAPHKRPRAIHVLDELPRNEMGKLQKKLLVKQTRSE